MTLDEAKRIARAILNRDKEIGELGHLHQEILQLADWVIDHAESQSPLIVHRPATKPGEWRAN